MNLNDELTHQILLNAAAVIAEGSSAIAQAKLSGGLEFPTNPYLGLENDFLANLWHAGYHKQEATEAGEVAASELIPESQAFVYIANELLIGSEDAPLFFMVCMRIAMDAYRLKIKEIKP